jgi:heme oxygenase
MGSSQREGPSKQPGFADRLRQRTRRLHAEAERAGIVRDIILGEAGVAAYALFLRNLLPVYRTLEEALSRLRQCSPLHPLADPRVFRAPALITDIGRLAGPGWEGRLPLLPAAAAYAAAIAAAADGNAGRLLAHAYVRYLGDLNGGLVLRRAIARLPGLADGSFAFYEFAGVADVPAFARAYRGAIDRAGAEIADPTAVIEEAARAFRLNIALSEAVAAAG